jgi:Zn finger protein HypA/HybF involved in hydrogenase expression
MPAFGSFSGLSLDKSLSKEELIRAVRFLVSAEYEAVDMYERIAEASPDEKIKKAIEKIIEEERVHAGEFLKMLTILDPEEAKFYQEGFKEVEDGMGKKTVSNSIRSLAKDVHEADYVWQKTEKGDAKTLMYKSPFTGKKFHVSPSASIDPEDTDIFKCTKCDYTAPYKDIKKSDSAMKCPKCQKPMFNTEDEKEVKCQKCGNSFDYGSQPEIAMGTVECPKCHSRIDQTGKVYSK